MITRSSSPLIELLGKPIDHPDVTRAVSELSNVPARDLPVQHSRVHVRARSLGLDITFKPAAKLRDGARLADSENDLLLAVLFFHSEGHEGYSRYAGSLPRDLRFDQSRKSVRAALGVPAGTGTQHKNDRWDTDEFYMTLDFSDDEQSITLITVGLHWKRTTV